MILYVLRQSRNSIEDLDFLTQLSIDTGEGFTSLPTDKKTLSKILADSDKSFSNPSEFHKVLFVLERLDTITDEITPVGVSSLKLSNNNLIMFKDQDTLNFKYTDTTSATELSTLFLYPEFSENYNSKLLIISRLMYLNSNKDSLPNNLRAEVRGHKEKHDPAIWKDISNIAGIPYSFKDIDYLIGVGYTKAEEIVSKLQTFQIPLKDLSKESLLHLGSCHSKSVGSFMALSLLGFKPTNEMYFADSGPILRSTASELTIEVTEQKVKVVSQLDISNNFYIVSRSSGEFKSIVVNSVVKDGYILILKEQYEALKLNNLENVNILRINK